MFHTKIIPLEILDSHHVSLKPTLTGVKMIRKIGTSAVENFESRYVQQNRDDVTTGAFAT